MTFIPHKTAHFERALEMSRLRQLVCYSTSAIMVVSNLLDV